MPAPINALDAENNAGIDDELKIGPTIEPPNIEIEGTKDNAEAPPDEAREAPTKNTPKLNAGNTVNKDDTNGAAKEDTIELVANPKSTKDKTVLGTEKEAEDKLNAEGITKLDKELNPATLLIADEAPKIKEALLDNGARLHEATELLSNIDLPTTETEIPQPTLEIKVLTIDELKVPAEEINEGAAELNNGNPEITETGNKDANPEELNTEDGTLKLPSNNLALPMLAKVEDMVKNSAGTDELEPNENLDNMELFNELQPNGILANKDNEPDKKPPEELRGTDKIENNPEPKAAIELPRVANAKKLNSVTDEVKITIGTREVDNKEDAKDKSANPDGINPREEIPNKLEATPLDNKLVDNAETTILLRNDNAPDINDELDVNDEGIDINMDGTEADTSEDLILSIPEETNAELGAIVDNVLESKLEVAKVVVTTAEETEGVFDNKLLLKLKGSALDPSKIALLKGRKLRIEPEDLIGNNKGERGAKIL